MASLSMLFKFTAKKPIEETNSPKITTKIVEQLFEQLFIDIEVPNRILSLSTIFVQLNDICQNLLTNNTSLVFDVINIILQNYIKLLDIDAINHADSIENNNFLRQLFCVLCRSDIQELVGRIPIKIRRELFFSLFDQVNASTRIISYLQNNLSIENQILINSCKFIFYTVLKVSDILNIKLTGNDLEKYQNNLFNPLIIFLDEYFIKKENFRVNDILIKEILLFICDITNQSLAIPILINANCSQACLRWFSLSYLDDYEYPYIIHILNNLARHDEGIIILNKSNCATIVRQFKNEILNTKIEFLIIKEWRLHVSRILDMILASVVDPDELHIEEVNTGTINQVLSLSRIASEAPDFTYRGYHISEPLIVLMKLCTNDHVIDYILQQNECLIFFFATLKTFLEKKKTDDDQLSLHVLTILALANIFWSMSFHERYKNELIQNINLIKKLEEFRDTEIIDHVFPYIFIPYQMSSLRRTLDGILQNLYPSKSEIKSSPKNPNIRSLMISYSHVNIQFCRQLSDVLKKLPELSIKVDINNGKYLWKEISQTIRQADVVLFLLSKNFYYSKSCRQEFIYATDTLKKLFFPVFIDPDFKPSGWLHQRIARLKSIRFGQRDFSTTCEELLVLINENLSMNISLLNNSLEVAKWNDQEIKQWFIKCNLSPELYEFYHFQNGNELLLYAHATLAFVWTKEYERIKLRFEEKFKEQEQNLSRDQFLQFIYALKRLPK